MEGRQIRGRQKAAGKTREWYRGYYRKSSEFSQNFHEYLIVGQGYGLDLIERVRTRSRGRILLRQGAVYPALREFERRELLRSWTVSRPGIGRPRTYYELTPKGIAEAQAQLETIAGFAATEAGAVVSSRELDAMRERLEICFGVTEFAMMLRRAGKAAGL